MLRLLAIVGVALLGLALLTGCAEEEEEGETATATPTATVVTTPEATPAATATATSGAPTAGLGKLAFVRDGDIWVMDLDSGQERQLTTDGQNWGPQWSADGGWIAFRKRVPVDESETLTELWTMRQDGSDGNLVVQSARVGPIWAPTDNRLTYATDEGALWLMDVESGERRQLLPAGDEVYRVAWSPNGERLAIERWIQGEELTPPPNTTVDQGIWLVNADGSGLTKLYGPYQRDQFGPVAYLGDWSPDGERITFWQGPMISASLRADGAPLHAIAVAGGEPTALADIALVHNDMAAWSPQGDRLAVVEGGGRETWVNKQIVVMGPDGRDRIVLSEAGRADLSPAWSPDGQRIAFTSGEGAGFESAYERYPDILRTRRIWVASGGGSDKLQLTDDPAYADEFSQWSADGGHILFVRQQAEAIGPDGDEPVRAEIWVMKADGGQQRKLLDGLSDNWFGYYGHLSLANLFDWYR
jgi:Tol biopolymer transport system component